MLNDPMVSDGYICPALVRSPRTVGPGQTISRRNAIARVQVGDVDDEAQPRLLLGLARDIV
jgi:hypothetical protein